MQPRRPDVYLELALVALRRVPRYLSNRSLEAYLADDYCESAVERQLEIAGDALGQLRKVAVLAHGYAALDHKRVYEVATLKAPELLKTLQSLLGEFPDE
jgi:uncharacterized protein with HEPN domain